MMSMMIDDDLVTQEYKKYVRKHVANNEGNRCILQEAHPLMISKQIVFST